MKFFCFVLASLMAVCLGCRQSAATTEVCPALTKCDRTAYARTGRLRFEAPAAMKEWRLTLTFNTDVLGIYSFFGRNFECRRGNVCSLTSDEARGNIKPGDLVHLRFDVRYTPLSTPLPSLLSATLADTQFPDVEYPICKS